MFKLESITISNALPEVFAQEESQRQFDSEIWNKQFTFTRGETYLVEASSGTGKSSLCNFIYGLRNDYRGTILFNASTDIRSLSTKQWVEIRQRHIAYLPQDMKLFPELTGFENVEIKNRLTNQKSESQIKEMFSRLGISDCLYRQAGKMSLGQQQRVAIVRSLCQPFNFLLLDEPVSHLDISNNRIVASLIAEEASANSAGIISTSVGNPLILESATFVAL